MQQQPESSRTVAVWVRMCSIFFVAALLWMLVIDIQIIWQSGFERGYKGLVAAITLGPVFSYIAVTGRTPGWGVHGADISQRATWKSLFGRK